MEENKKKSFCECHTLTEFILKGLLVGVVAYFIGAFIGLNPFTF
jgi:hypothetical protein